MRSELNQIRAAIQICIPNAGDVLHGLFLQPQDPALLDKDCRVFLGRLRELIGRDPARKEAEFAALTAIGTIKGFEPSRDIVREFALDDGYPHRVLALEALAVTDGSAQKKLGTLTKGEQRAKQRQEWLDSLQ